MGISEYQLRILEGNAARARGVELPTKKERPVYRSKTEAAYAAYLDLFRPIGGEWRYEPVTLKLGHDCRYTPDFLVMHGKDMEFHEVKGRKGDSYYSRPVGKVKVRVAAALYPWWTFCIVWPEKNGEWAREVVR